MGKYHQVGLVERVSIPLASRRISAYVTAEIAASPGCIFTSLASTPASADMASETMFVSSRHFIACPGAFGRATQPASSAGRLCEAVPCAPAREADWDNTISSPGLR